MKNILTEALVNSATNASFIFSYTNSAKLRCENQHLRPTDISCHNIIFLQSIFLEIKKCLNTINKGFKRNINFF